MAKNLIEVENDAFSCKQTGDFALVTLNQGVNEIVANNEIKDAFLATFSKIDNALEIRGIVIANSSEYKGRINLQSLTSHISEVLKHERRDIAIQRFRNSLVQLVNLFINLKKPTIVAWNGEIGQSSFGLSLACDFRFATSNTSFHLQTVKLGLPAAGVLAYYFVKYLGLPRSIDILLTKTSLSVPEANDLGLLTDVTTEEELIVQCIAKLKDISQYPSNGISAIKRLLRPDADEISKLIDRDFDEYKLNLNVMEKSTA